jgi:hypothetical protein
MADETQESSSLQCAIRRLSSLLERTRSSKRNFTCHRPNKDATPSRSALKGGRWPGLPEERRVSFHDSLPCLRLGPPFEYQPSPDAEPIDRKTGLLLPAITADDRNADACLRQVEYSPKRVHSSLDDTVVPQSVARRNSAAGPATLHRTTTVRFPRAGSEGIPDQAERRRSCLDFTSAMMEERSRSQSRMRPRPLFADRMATNRSSWPSVSVRLNSPFAQAADPCLSYLEWHEKVSDNEGHDDTVSTYRAHVDRSIVSMQRQDKRHSWYLLDSLVQMQGALSQTLIETPQPRPRPVSDDGTSSAHIRVLLRQLETGNDGPSDNETKVNLAQRSVDTYTHAAAGHRDAPIRPNDLDMTAGTDAASDDTSAQRLSAPPIPSRHAGRPSEIALGKRRVIKPTENVEDKDVLNDSGVSITM